MKFEFEMLPKRVEIEQPSFSVAKSLVNMDDYKLISIDGNPVVGFCKKTGEPITKALDHVKRSNGDLYLVSAIVI